jgi:hypothetical protein
MNNTPIKLKIELTIEPELHEPHTVSTEEMRVALWDHIYDGFAPDGWKVGELYIHRATTAPDPLASPQGILDALSDGGAL